jgi:hypothetical protein
MVLHKYNMASFLRVEPTVSDVESVQVFRFAHLAYAQVKSQRGVDVLSLPWNEKDRERKFVIAAATDIRRRLGDDHLTRHTVGAIQDWLDMHPSNVAVLVDLRRDDEEAALRAAFGPKLVTVLVTDPTKPVDGVDFPLTTPTDATIVVGGSGFNAVCNAV